MKTAVPPRLVPDLTEQLNGRFAAAGIAGRAAWFEEVGSTNDTICDLVAAGDDDLIAVLAEHQSAGRGRFGARWFSAPGQGLLMSVCLDRSTALERTVTGIGALAVTEACRAAGLNARIKWLNDVLINGRKVSGILAEQRRLAGRECFILGIGVNVNNGAADLPPDSASITTSMHLAGGGTVFDRAELAAGIIGRVLALHAQAARGDAARFTEQWYAHLAVRDSAVILKPGQTPVRGRLCGMEADGRLRVETPEGAVTCAFEDLIVLDREE